MDPYCETEEKAITTTASSSHKEKIPNQRLSNSQQTTLQLSHSPTNKSHVYYDNATNSKNGSEVSRANTNPSTSLQGNRLYGHLEQGNSRKSNENNNYDCHDRSIPNERSELQHHYQQSPTRNSGGSYAKRTYSLPRQQHQQEGSKQTSGYYTQDRRARSGQRHSASKERRQFRDGSLEDPRLIASGGADTPDFYFMPSQRKYSGEVVRVYVDYNKDPKH